MCKKHYKNRYFSTKKKKKNKKWKKRAIFNVNNWAKLKSIIGPSWVRLKKRQLGPIIDFENLRAFFFSFQKFAETPIFRERGPPKTPFQLQSARFPQREANFREKKSVIMTDFCLGLGRNHHISPVLSTF